MTPQDRPIASGRSAPWRTKSLNRRCNRTLAAGWEGTARCRKSKRRSNRQLGVSVARHSRCTRKSRGMRSLAWFRSSDARSADKSGHSATAAQPWPFLVVTVNPALASVRAMISVPLIREYCTSPASRTGRTGRKACKQPRVKTQRSRPR